MKLFTEIIVVSSGNPTESIQKPRDQIPEAVGITRRW
jgi:hypothetical protein